MNYNDIRRLVKLVESSGIEEIEIGEGESKLRITKHAASTAGSAPAMMPYPFPSGYGMPTMGQSSAPTASDAPASSAIVAAPAKKLHEVQSPMVGTFYRAPSPEAPVYAQVGDQVKAGQALCIIEAMKLMNEIEADVSGRVTEILVENGQPVEFGQTMFRIDPS